MAKITRYTKDTLGQSMLLAASLILIFWLVMAGLNAGNPTTDPTTQQTGSAGSLWYYLGIPVVGALWGIANFEREPSGFGSRKVAMIMYLVTGSLIGAVMWMFMFALRYPDIVSQFLLGS